MLCEKKETADANHAVGLTDTGLVSEVKGMLMGC